MGFLISGCRLKDFGTYINKKQVGARIRMRSEQFKSVNDRELAEQYLALDEED